MSIGGVLSGFVKGYETASDVLNRDANTAKTREETRRLKPATDKDLAGIPDPSVGGGGIYEGAGGTDPTTTSSTGTAGADTNEVASRLKADLMKDFKISDVAAGGIVASLAAESGGFKTMQEINPTVKGSRGGYGYAQWTGPRRLEFEKYAKDNNLDINSYEANYGNLKRELQGPEGAILKDLANAKDYHQATQIFTGSAKEGRGFLRPGDVNMSGRFAWADKVAGVKPFSGTQETGEAGTDVAADELAPITKRDSSVDEANEPSDALARKEKRKARTDVAANTGIDMSAPQVADSGPIYEEPDETAFAARGGVIPEPKQRRKKFAEGGATEDPAFGGWGSLLSNNTATGGSTNGGSDTGNAADYNTGFGNATFTEENAPVAGWFDAGDTTRTDQGAAPVNSVLSTQTNTQQADPFLTEDPYNTLRDTTQEVAAETPAATTSTAIPDNSVGFYERGTGADTTSIVTQPAAAAPVAAAPAANTGPYGGLTQAQWMLQHGYGTLNPSTGWYDKGTYGVHSRATGGMVYAQGGAIPDPASPPVRKYAGGGSVFGDYWQPAAKATNRDERFQQLLKIESRGMQPGEGGSSTARDRAAKRLAAEEGRPSSSAYKPGQGGKKAPGRKIRTGPKTDPITTKSTPEIADPHTNVTPSPKPEIADPHTNVKRGPTPEIADPHTNVTPAAKPEIADPHTNVTPTKPAVPPPDPGRLTSPDIIRKVLPEPPDTIPENPVNVGNAMDPGATGVTTDVTDPAIPEPEASPADIKSDVDANRIKAAEQEAIVRGKREDASLNALPQNTPPAPPAPAPLPIVPDKIDLRPAPISTAPAGAVTPPVDTRPDHAKLLKGAMNALAKGQDPQAIANLLRNAGITEELWPLELQNAVLGMARGGRVPGFAPGGAIPEPGQQGYNESVAMGETAEPERLQATPRLRNDVATALDSGVHMLKKVFNLGGEGAVPTPEDPAMKAQGARRLASGEGAATPDEIQQIDQKIDPDNRLDEASKAMTRLAKTTQWYLEQGRPEDAAASAMALMQAGAQKFGRIGSMAKAAYNEYQKSKDPQDLQATVKFLEKAYEQIPDGANINISINPDTQQLQVAKTNADGEEEMHDISAAELPGLISQAQSGSYYWQEIFKLADPKGYESKLTSERQAADDARTRTEWDRQHGITSKEDIEKEERVSKRDIEKAEREAKAAREAELEKRGYESKEHDRQAKLAAGIAAAAEDRKSQTKRTEAQKEADIDTTLGPAMEAKAAYKADPTPENKAKLDAAASAVYKASGFDDSFMIGSSLAPGDDFTYVSSSTVADQTPPVAGAERRLDKQGKEGWFVQKDGKWYPVVAEEPVS